MKPLKLGTRKSPLALWQASFIKKKLESYNHKVELVEISSKGEKNLVKPLYEMGIQGIFTKELDTALVNEMIDIAVHSLKDVPTILAKGLKLVSVPERGDDKDLLVYKDLNPFSHPTKVFTIATSSLRRKAQWLNMFPSHKVIPIRGNVNKRLKKFEKDKGLNGALFASVGLERIDLTPPNSVKLDNVITAPGQGALGLLCRKDDISTIEICQKINSKTAYISTFIERQFLNRLQGGCTMPIGAYAFEDTNKKWVIKGFILSLDGKNEAKVQLSSKNWKSLGKQAAENLLKSGGQKIHRGILSSK